MLYLAAQPVPCAAQDHALIRARVVQMAAHDEGPAGQTTYRLKLALDPARARNCYTIFGQRDSGPISMPPAYQVRSHTAALRK